MKSELKSFLFFILFAVGLFLIYFHSGLIELFEGDNKTVETRQYVYACPVDNYSKCYKIVADTEGDCPEELNKCYYTYSELLFPDGSVEELGYCEVINNNKQICIERESNKKWEIEFAERYKSTRN